MEPIIDPIIRETMSYWCRLRQGRDMPGRADIDPCDIPSHILPQLLLVDVIEGKRFRCRLVGTGLVKATGWDHTGRFIDDADADNHPPPEAQRAYLGDLYREVVSVRQPIYTSGLYLNGRQVEGTVKRLIMPLSEDGVTVNKLLGVLSFTLSRPGRKPRAPERGYVEETRTMALCSF